jgi:hypothetical protein
LKNTAVSGARLYWETFGKLGYFNVKGVSIPVAVSSFPDEIYTRRGVGQSRRSHN